MTGSTSSDRGRSLAELIVLGGADDCLDIIVEAVRKRRSALSAQSAAELFDGDRVTFVDGAQEGFIGLEGVVTKVRGVNVTVRVDTGGFPRSRGGRKKPIYDGALWTVPGSWLRKIEKPVHVPNEAQSPFTVVGQLDAEATIHGDIVLNPGSGS
jgi:hypothetical protein